MMPEAEGQEPEAQEPKTFDESYVKELRGEAAQYRVERNELRKQVETLTSQIREKEDSEKTDAERMATKLADLERSLADKEREMAEATVKNAVLNEASKMNLVDPDAAYQLVDLNLIDENPKSVGKALEVLIKDKPYLLKSTQPPTPGAGGPPVQGSKSTDDMWADLLRQGARTKPQQ